MFKKKFVIFVALLLVAVVSIGCSAKSGKYVDGTYTGTGEGKYGPIKMEITVEKGNITTVKALEHSETPGLSDPVFEKISKAIVEKQTAEVDVVSGGTVTSQGIIDAAKDALKAAAK
ncbi:Uncharacterized protein, contains FMN-binding domain [Geosporobacter subterraneus DSM 17957]|uniref:Uncharacterized protein, contains FMN-binding domain n=1 Tax=Geosporobacter subterraneus DSM 17957 TaxID=1121919 RepID=A0A1M6MN33_9FIRM|nr:FMN-binding protein [Geosporobacter subterraneus]SHJ84891.1 Uncharacterized protein, contains FMN-binding domain [Geosporobacter subterraneus DSM 17957]